MSVTERDSDNWRWAGRHDFPGSSRYSSVSYPVVLRSEADEKLAATRDQLRGAVEAIAEAMRLLTAPGEHIEDRVHDGYARLAKWLPDDHPLGGQ